MITVPTLALLHGQCRLMLVATEGMGSGGLKGGGGDGCVQPLSVAEQTAAPSPVVVLELTKTEGDRSCHTPNLVLCRCSCLTHLLYLYQVSVLRSGVGIVTILCRTTLPDCWLELNAQQYETQQYSTRIFA